MAFEADPSVPLAVARYLQRYGTVWNRHFPNYVRRGHWHIANMLRSEEDGVFFSAIRGRMDDVFGMDEDTCALRVRDFVADGFATVTDSAIRASTLVVGTAKLAEVFDAHVVDAANALRRTAARLGLDAPPAAIRAGGPALNRCFGTFSTRYSEVWAERVKSFLKQTLPSSPAVRIKAQRQLMDYAHRHIFLTAWMHRQLGAGAKAPYLLVDDFHLEIYPRLGVNAKTTAGHVQDLIHWGFLVRLQRHDGVPRNKFAVRMTDAAFEHFAGAFAEALPIIADVARQLASFCAAPPARPPRTGARGSSLPATTKSRTHRKLLRKSHR